MVEMSVVDEVVEEVPEFNPTSMSDAVSCSLETERPAVAAEPQRQKGRYTELRRRDG